MLDPSDVLAGKVLIVDDQQASVRLLERMLHGAGYSCVESTQDPRQVVELHSKNRYDLILLDLQMPGMDGFQVLDALKQIEKDKYLSVLVMTAHPGHKQRALLSGAKDFISKPFNAVEVLARVYNMLELRILQIQNGKALSKARWSAAASARVPPGSRAVDLSTADAMSARTLTIRVRKTTPADRTAAAKTDPQMKPAG